MGDIKNRTLDYNSLINEFPWITKENQKAIISPDVDGMLCGLLMSYYYNSEIVGFYDGKKLAIKQNIKPSECIFLDIEIYRQEVKSCGHHMLLYNKKNISISFKNNFSNCINPNIMRDFDSYSNFKEKYPLAMIHFMLCIISSQKKITIPKTAVPILLYADGTFKNLLNYPENCIGWLNFLNAKDPNNPIYPLYINFANLKIATMIHQLEVIFKKFLEFNDFKKRGGDKIKISDISNNSFSTDSITKIKKLITLLSDYTQWKYNSEKWALNGLNILSFSKNIEQKINNKKYTAIINKNPLSWAITATKQIEYTLEKPDKLY